MENYIEHPEKLLQQLIRFDTTNPPGNERLCIEFIGKVLDSVDVPSKTYYQDADRPNLVARIKGQGIKPPLLLYGHVDVVTTKDQQWEVDPFSGDIVDGCIWGRGSADMKGGIAMMLSAFMRVKVEQVQLPFDLLFIALSDEEVGGDLGARYMVETYPEIFQGVKYAISEFGGFKLSIDGTPFFPIQVAEKQGCGLEIVVSGPAGHGSTIQQGGTIGRLGNFLTKTDKKLLPIHITEPYKQMARAMAKSLPVRRRILIRLGENHFTSKWALKSLGDLGNYLSPLLRNTMNITIINGGNAVNVIPSEIKMNADVRILPGYSQEDVIGEIRNIYKGDVDIKVVYSSRNPAKNPDMGLFDILSKTLREYYPDAEPVPFFMAGVTDARFFNRLGIQTYGFTPIMFPEEVSFIEMMHAANERVTVESVIQGTDIIYDAIMGIASL